MSHNLLTAAICAVICAATSAPALAQTMLLPGTSQRGVLNGQCEYEIVDFTQSLVNPAYQGEMTVLQSPPPGTTYSGPQTAFVTVHAESDAGHTQDERFRLDIIDLTPPSVSVGLPPSPERLLAPGGLHYYYVSPDAAIPEVVVSDSCDSSPLVQYKLDGQQYVPGTPVGGPGVHVLKARAVDASGNVGESQLLFSIRDKPNRGGLLVPESFDFIPTTGDMALVFGYLLVAGDDIDESNLNLSTFSLWLEGNEGRWINSVPITIDGAYPVAGGTYEYVSTDAWLEDCVWRLGFNALVPVLQGEGAPVALAVSGRGSVGTSDEFDFLARGNVTVPQDPMGVFIDEGLWCDGPGIGPGPEPEPSCVWVTQVVPLASMPDSDSNSESGDCCGYTSYAFAKPASIHGNGNAYDGCYPIACDSSDGAASVGGQVVQGYFSPPDCCADCRVSVTAQPMFVAVATLNPPGEAIAGGIIDVAVGGCGQATASGGAAVSSSANPTITINGVQVPLSVGEQSSSVPVVGNLIPCTLNQCSITVSVVTGVGISNSANATMYNWGANAHSHITDASLNLTITPECLSGEAGPLEPVWIGLDSP